MSSFEHDIGGLGRFKTRVSSLNPVSSRRVPTRASSTSSADLSEGNLSRHLNQNVKKRKLKKTSLCCKAWYYTSCIAHMYLFDSFYGLIGTKPVKLLL